MDNINQGAISALKGYRVQFLYTLYRIITQKKDENAFHPEGKFEDLDIYNIKGEPIEVIQVKSYSRDLTLSNIINDNGTSFLRRAAKAFEDNNQPIVRLVSFGDVNEDIRELSSKKYSKQLIAKLQKFGLKNAHIKFIEEKFELEIVNESDLRDNIVKHIVEWTTFLNIDIAIDLLIFWIYETAEKQFEISSVVFKEQIEKISKYESERSSFAKTYNSLIRPLDSSLETYDHVKLKSDFYKGISATYHHILAGVDVIRPSKLELINEKFSKSNIVFIHGASGQGKSTLAYRYINEYRASSTTFELKKLPQDSTSIYEVINALDGISKGIRFPITIYLDIEPGNKGWIDILRELSSKYNFKFIVTIREEDWNSIELGDKFSYSELELTFDKEEAELLYESINTFNTDFKFLDFDNAWETFGGSGPLLEFVYLITQNETLSAKLRSQINGIREDSEQSSFDKIKILRYVVLADCFGAQIKLKEFNDFLRLQTDIISLTNLLQKEYLIKISSDKTYISGLHPVRSEIIKSYLFDKEINTLEAYAVNSISFISDNSLYNFLRNTFRYTNLNPNELLEQLNSYTPKSWETYHALIKSLLWKGTYDYVSKNIDLLDSIHKKYNKGWITVVNFDLTGILDGSIMETANFFNTEQNDYAKSINAQFSDKNEIFSYCNDLISKTKTISILPLNEREWVSFSYCMFWFIYLNKKHVECKFNQFAYDDLAKVNSATIIAEVIYVLKEYSEVSRNYVETVKKTYLKVLSEKHKVISIEENEDEIIAYYILDIFEERIEEKGNFQNNESVRIIDSLRLAYPEKKLFGANSFGNKFNFFPDNHDFSYKRINKKNLPLKNLVEINSIYTNLFNYTTRPNTWKDYTTIVNLKRQEFNEFTSDFISALDNYNHAKSTIEIVNFAIRHSEKETHNSPLFPINVSDKWGEFSESTNRNDALKPAISTDRYLEYNKLFSDYCNSMENFKLQSIKVVVNKLRSINKLEVFDEHLGRVSLVANLFKAYEIISDFQLSYRQHFEKFSTNEELDIIEKVERNNLKVLCFIYRQFIYSDNYISNDSKKDALNRFKEIYLAFHQKINEGFKILSKQYNLKVNIQFDEEDKRCILMVKSTDALKSFEYVKIIYDRIFELIDKPAYDSIKHLVLNTSYPVVNILIMPHGKTINTRWYEFRLHNLREKTFEELPQYTLIPVEIPKYLADKYKIRAWDKEMVEFENLNELLKSVVSISQLAYHYSQLRAFNDKEINDFSEKTIEGYLKNIYENLQKNLQQSYNALGYYIMMCDEQRIEFDDDAQEFEFIDFLIENRKNLFPNDESYSKNEISLSLTSDSIDIWLKKLAMLTNNISFLYYFLADKIINRKIKDFNLTDSASIIKG